MDLFLRNSIFIAIWPSLKAIILSTIGQFTDALLAKSMEELGKTNIPNDILIYQLKPQEHLQILHLYFHWSKHAPSISVVIVALLSLKGMCERNNNLNRYLLCLCASNYPSKFFTRHLFLLNSIFPAINPTICRKESDLCIRGCMCKDKTEKEKERKKEREGNRGNGIWWSNAKPAPRKWIKLKYRWMGMPSRHRHESQWINCSQVLHIVPA